MTFLESLPSPGPARERAVSEAITAGRLDAPTWVPVRCGPVDLLVSADYLTIDGSRVPMSAPNAQRAAEALGGVLPTSRMVRAIEDAARAKGRVVALPTRAPNGAAQMSRAWILWCEEATRAALAAAGAMPGMLVAGHRKDVVLARHMPPGEVVIFGAVWPDGKRLQPLYPVAGGKPGHEAAYHDYSHGVRVVRDECAVDGTPMRVSEILLSAGRAAWLSDEGPLPSVRYPLSSAPQPAKPSGPRVLRRGMIGDDVKELQVLLGAKGYVLTRDGVFGGGTHAAVVDYQEAAGLDPDGAAGPATMASLRAGKASALPYSPPPISDVEVDALFGPLLWTAAPTSAEPGAIRITNGWQKDNLRRVVIPQLVGVEGAPKDGAIFLHRLIVEQTRALWAAWEAAGLLPLVRTWAGSWNPRLVRGSSTLSRHAYAIAWDVNAAWNGLGKPPAPAGAVGSVVELVPLAVEHGYAWGGSWNRPDGMHAEACRVL